MPLPNLFHLPRTSPDSCFSQNKSTGTFINLFERSTIIFKNRILNRFRVTRQFFIEIKWSKGIEMSTSCSEREKLWIGINGTVYPRNNYVDFSSISWFETVPPAGWTAFTRDRHRWLLAQNECQPGKKQRQPRGLLKLVFLVGSRENEKRQGTVLSYNGIGADSLD